MSVKVHALFTSKFKQPHVTFRCGWSCLVALHCSCRTARLKTGSRKVLCLCQLPMALLEANIDCDTAHSPAYVLLQTMKTRTRPKLAKADRGITQFTPV